MSSHRATAFNLGREGADDGSFRRQESRFRRWVSADGSTEFALESGRYHLYVARACPWAHRTIIGRVLMGLEEEIGISFVDPIRDSRGWAFGGEDYVDQVNGFEFLSQAYAATDPGYEDRVSVPVLWDRQAGVIVSNESADILRMLSTVFAPLAAHPVALSPQPLRRDIDQLNAFIYDNVNNAVYKAGFSRAQAVYEREVNGLFAALDQLDARLTGRRFLFGAEPVETDWRLFTTLLRFDAVYNIHFKCSVRKLVEYEHLWPYARDLFQQPGVADTVSFDEIRRHYYLTHPMINPSGLVAVRPDADFSAPAGRERLGSGSSRQPTVAAGGA
ncbi:MAG: glutathione S-transferase C-terminal domain-containing protein [Solirubrobacterales bacterium]|nr:glutathione S-transferase C-terminal domain-containing protein [Solirubrobacterales bacterium]MBV9717240.1 glutathione S-transferase C-terminal domain-containing protein [Solirubrobacterales bacterium]